MCDKLVDSFCVLGDSCVCYHQTGLIYSDLSGWQRQAGDLDELFDEEYPQFSKFGG